VVEVILGTFKFYTANMYLDVTEKLDKDIKLINDILQLANKSGILITMDSNSRSRMWHDKLTNGRGKELEEFLISRQLFIMNGKSEMKTFQSSRGSSNIDLTISNSKLLKEVQAWKISKEESCSDHKIIKFCIRQYNVQQIRNNFQGIKYITRGENIGKSEASLTQEIAKEMCESSLEEEDKDLDKYILSQNANIEDVEDVVNKFSDALRKACNKSFKRAEQLRKQKIRERCPGGQRT
jgi:hypothetical protein